MKQMIGPTILFNNLSLYGGSRSELLSALLHFLRTFDQKEGGFLKIFTPNPEQMVLATENQNFHTILSHADILLPDGNGLVWAINRNPRNKQKVQRITGREVFHDLLYLAKEKNLVVFLLGGKPGSASSLLLEESWEYDEGAKDITHETPEERDRVLEKIQKVRPDLLFVAYGAPWQERWVSENQESLKRAGVKIAMVVGGAFEYEAGKVPRVSPFMESLHLEWLQRLLFEPWRWKRQLNGLKFFWWTLTGK